MKRKIDNSNIEPTSGTGSAEQTGRNRSEQQSKNKEINKEARKNVARQAGLSQEQIATPKDLGATSGRDDYAGGSGDDMSSQNTNEPTGRGFII